MAGTVNRCLVYDCLICTINPIVALQAPLLVQFCKHKCDRICEKGSYTRIRFSNFDKA